MTIRNQFKGLSPFSIVLLAACTQSAPDQPARSAQALTRLPGFVHVAAQAFSDPTSARMEKLSSGATRLENDHVQHVAHRNGWAMSLAKTAYKLETPPFPGTGEDHNQAVRAHFASLGLPADQIGSVGEMPLVFSEASEEQSETGTIPPDRTLGYVSSVSRRLEGILVLESVAAATLDENGEPLAQNVYWPELPRQVLDDALTLRARLEDPHVRAAYLAQLDVDTKGRDTEVVIHHTHAVDDSPFEAFAVFEVYPLDGTTETSALFDKDGKRVWLQLERPRVRDAAARQSQWQDNSKCAVTGDFRLPSDQRAAIHVAESGAWAFAREDVRLEGQIERTADGIVITDDERSSTTACKSGVEGRYKLQFQDGCDTLRFARVDDACEPRARMLDGMVLKRGAEPPTVQLGADGTVHK